MVNELRDLRRENVASPPYDNDTDLSTVLRATRRRVRRRLTVVGVAAVASLAAGGVTSSLLPSPPELDAGGIPAPDAPTLHLSEAQEAVEGDDYRVLASRTDHNLERDNGAYFDGVTQDGLILFRDGPSLDQPRRRLALLDPATGDKDWLPDPPVSDHAQLWPVDLATKRLVLTGYGNPHRDDTSFAVELFALIYDRETGRWQRLEWPDLLTPVQPGSAALGPDGRLYVRLPATKGQPTPDGWRTGPDGEGYDADATGDSYRLWSVSLTDTSDIRDEGLRVGDFTFVDTSLVWTDATNGDSGLVHVRDLATGAEHAFDAHAGDRCNLLSFGASDARVVLGQYCGTYDDGRDDRVQVLTTDGQQVVTIQGSGLDGGLGGTGDVVTVTAYERGEAGTYLYDLGSDRFMRVSDGVSKFALGGPTSARRFLWDTPVNHRHGATQRLGALLD
jgi:hypothetical protein